MDAVLFGAAVAAYVVAAVSYFRGLFRSAFLLGCLVWALLGRVLLGTMHPGWAWSLYVPFALMPALLVVIHAVDARRGYFRLPTIYSIPLAFLAGALLLICAGIGVVLA